MACVLDVLRGETNRRPVALTEWQDAFQVAEHENILPYFAATLRQSGVPLPAPIQDNLAVAEREAARNSFWWTSELRGILQAFAARAIPVVPLKGPMLAERIYGGINLRQSCDLDLLVMPQHIGSANSLLEKLGFTSSSSPIGFHYLWHRGTTCVELHFDVVDQRDFNFDTVGACRRARPREFLGQPVLQFAPTDELLYLCLHGVRHHFKRLTYVLDIVLALNCLTPEIDSTAYEVGPAARLRRLIVLGSAMAMRLDPRCNFALELHESAKTAAHIEKLANKRWTVLLQGRGTAFDWLDQEQFYLQTEATTTGPLRRQLRILADLPIRVTRTSQSDFNFAARFGVKQPALVWMLRQFRLLARLCGRRFAIKKSSE
jgi:hypothetical protein